MSDRKLHIEEMGKILSRPNAGWIRAVDLTRKILSKYPASKPNSIAAIYKAVCRKNPEKFVYYDKSGSEVYYAWKKNVEGKPYPESLKNAQKKRARKSARKSVNAANTGGREKGYEKPLCDYLKELNECSRAIPYGKQRGGPKWSNPDVIGILQHEQRARTRFVDEVVSVEIKKINRKNAEYEILKGFGQACAYLLFSHKAYLVVCKKFLNGKGWVRDEFWGRLESMCHLVGLGLIYFDEQKRPTPNTFDIQLRARKQLPDINYLNQIMEKAYDLLYKGGN